MSSLNTGAFTVSQDPLSGIERSQLKALSEADKFYRLKAVVTNQDGDRLTFLTSSKAVFCYSLSKFYFNTIVFNFSAL